MLEILSEKVNEGKVWHAKREERDITE